MYSLGGILPDKQNENESTWLTLLVNWLILIINSRYKLEAIVIFIYTYSCEVGSVIKNLSVCFQNLP